MTWDILYSNINYWPIPYMMAYTTLLAFSLSDCVILWGLRPNLHWRHRLNHFIDRDPYHCDASSLKTSLHSLDISTDKSALSCERWANRRNSILLKSVIIII